MSLRVTLCAIAITAGVIAACTDGGSSDPSTGTIVLPDGGTAPADPGSSTTPTTPPAGAAGDFCAKTLGVVATALEGCCSAEDKATLDYKLSHDLVVPLTATCTTTLDASIAKGRVLYRADRGDACYAAYKTTYGSGQCGNITQTYSDPAGNACREAFVGTGAVDAPCRGSHECTDGLTCVGFTDDADGACKAPPVVGEVCGKAPTDAGGSGSFTISSSTLRFGSHPECATGARCETATGKCQAAPDGSTCASDDGCSFGSHCVLRVCGAAEPGGEGAPCLQAQDCARGLYCPREGSGAQAACAKRLPAGAACGASIYTATACAGRCSGGLGKPGNCASFCGSL